jgi:hypothetical protein
VAEKQFSKTILLALETISGFTTFPVSTRYKICLAAIFNNPIVDKAFQKNKTLLIFSGKKFGFKNC